MSDKELIKLKTGYKYITFEIWGMEELKKWECLNKRSGSVLGWAVYYEEWKQWVMEFQPECVFNNTCLQDIADFLEQLNKKERA